MQPPEALKWLQAKTCPEVKRLKHKDQAVPSHPTPPLSTGGPTPCAMLEVWEWDGRWEGDLTEQLYILHTIGTFLPLQQGTHK